MTQRIRRGVVKYTTRSVGFIECADSMFYALHGREIEPFPFSLIGDQFNMAMIRQGDEVTVEPGWCTSTNSQIRVHCVSERETVVSRLSHITDRVLSLVERRTSREAMSKHIAEYFEDALSSGEPDRLGEAVAKRVGEGNGLTPSADDIVVGLASGMVATQTWNDHFEALQFGIASVVAGQTTEVSQALLTSAAAKRFPPALTDLCNNLGSVDGINTYLDRVARIGANSGQDMITGLALALRAAASRQSEKVES